MSNAPNKIKVLMIGTDKSTGGGMWTVANNYIQSKDFNKTVLLKYIPTFVVGSNIKKIMFALLAYIRIFLYLVSERPQILHVHMSERGSVARKGVAIKIAKRLDCKIIIHMHGAEFQTWYETLDEQKKNKVFSILNSADTLIILGNYWKSFIGTIVPLEKLKVVYNGVDLKDNSYNPDGSTLLFLGAVGQRKGAYDLVKAFTAIKDRIPKSINLRFYGPDFEHKIEDEIKKSLAEDRIQYCGWLDKEKREKVFADTLCNVLPSYNEGLPMTILETMASGIPNISTNVAAIPEVLNNENGYLIEPGDISALEVALEKLCNDRHERVDKSIKAYEEIKQKFTIEDNVNAILKIYEELL